MKNIKAIILCEGETDQILIGLYLESISQYHYITNKKFENIFINEKINWYTDNSDNIIGIWDNGGNNFDSSIKNICDREKNIEHLIEHVVIITDHDDETVENDKPKKIYELLSSGLGTNSQLTNTLKNNEWLTFNFEAPFSCAAQMKVCYLLVPLEEQGALETYMLSALTEDKAEQKEVIEQAKEFIENIHTEVYLKGRRLRTKAVMGVSLSVFNPEGIFRIMNEILHSVNWSKFEISQRQFRIISDLVDGAD